MLNQQTLSITSLFSLFAIILVLVLEPKTVIGADGKPLSTTPSKQKKPDYEDDYLRIRLIRRSPKQIAAFYEGRQFPKSAITKVSEACFIAAIIHNKTRDILWLDLDQWRFQGQHTIKRLGRDYWKQQWRQANVDKPSQATFGWTLLPEQRNLMADEGVGGNITLPQQSQEFTILAHFDRGADRQLPAIDVTLPHVRCKQDSDTK